jgi:hypothetical protein
MSGRGELRNSLGAADCEVLASDASDEREQAYAIRSQRSILIKPEQVATGHEFINANVRKSIDQAVFCSSPKMFFSLCNAAVH